MSRNPAATITKFLNCLNLEKLDDNKFSGHSPDFGWRRIFGGQFIAQSLVAAQRTVADDRHVHSLHGYFLNPGDPDVPIVFMVDRVRDGSSFCMRSVRAEQNGRIVFSMQASFQKLEDGFNHQDDMPDVPQPDELDVFGVLDMAPDEIIRPLKAYINRERPFEFRPVSIERFVKTGYLEPQQSVWLKLIADSPAASDPALSAAMLSYISDSLLIDTALFPHSTNIFDGRLQGASLDHAMWFHRPFKLCDWVLYHMQSPNSSGARGMARGSLFAKDGTLLASVAQEGLIRKRRYA